MLETFGDFPLSQPGFGIHSAHPDRFAEVLAERLRQVLGLRQLKLLVSSTVGLRNAPARSRRQARRSFSTSSREYSSAW
jgi:hypothetical protein